MSIEDHFRVVDWNRVHKKHLKMEQAKREITNILMGLGMILFISSSGIVEQLESVSIQPGLPILRMMLKTIPFVMLLGLVYSGYNYFKWSRYNVMHDRSENKKEE